MRLSRVLKPLYQGVITSPATIWSYLSFFLKRNIQKNKNAMIRCNYLVRSFISLLQKLKVVSKMLFFKQKCHVITFY